ncbi:MAG: 3-deoxy-7-phosphoheptulonate synthase [Clostridiaceae bacterium]|nr:3-deoxy-7-phosphoheptulonate synthase [Clostridiaceae bacterium]
MNFSILGPIPSAEEILRRYPLSQSLRTLKHERDEAIRAVFNEQSDRLILVVGPCSADLEDSVCAYSERLGRLQERVADRLILIPRIYTNKPRTDCSGYKGILHQPDPEKEPDIAGGLLALRHMHIRSMEQSGLTAADEMLYPENHVYLDDVLSYVAIGARSVENQQHRLTASAISQPAGMKNPTSGDLSVMLHAIYAARQSHVFTYQGQAVKTAGNPLAHAVLRGAVNKYGQNQPNYHFEDLKILAAMFDERQIEHPACLIDTNHANSNKQFDEQPRIALEVMHSRRHSPEIRQLVKGFMIESYLEEGCQSVNQHVFGRSITDPCMGWTSSEDLILRIADLA